MVHALLGYVHKDLALKLFIMVQQYVMMHVFTILYLTLFNRLLNPREAD
jgi:hypothetical protein